MEYNKTKKLPIGVGKKIVEALKKQPKAYDDEFGDINEVKIVNNSFESAYSATSPKNQDRWNRIPVFEEYEDVSVEENDYKYSSINKSEDEEYDYEDTNNLYDQSSEEDYEISNNYNRLKNQRQEYENYHFLDEENNYSDKPSKTYPAPSVRKKQRASAESTENTKKEFSSNIETLTRLIHQLPSGVTRQTGAQIIRQTMEAIGMSMNKVLTEAQQAQEGHAQKIKEHLNSIEEYKNNIRILEKELQKNKKRVDDLDDIISLFILTERDKKK